MRRQSEHYVDYRTALATLDAMGLIYPSFESRAEIAALVAAREPWPRDPDGAPLYPGNAKIDGPRRACPPHGRRRALRAAPRHGRRAREDRLAHLAGNRRRPSRRNRHYRRRSCRIRWGDVILARKETPTSYHLAVVVDDAAQGVTDVVRGRDLFHATSVHRLLQALLGLPAPRYHHHRLILDADGNKLSKSTLATGLRELRARGACAADIRKLVGLD